MSAHAMPILPGAKRSLLIAFACKASISIGAASSPSLSPMPAGDVLSAFVGTNSDGEDIESHNSEKVAVLGSNTLTVRGAMDLFSPVPETVTMSLEAANAKENADAFAADGSVITKLPYGYEQTQLEARSTNAPSRALQDVKTTTGGSLNWPLYSNDTMAGYLERAPTTGKYPIKVPDVYYYVEVGFAREILRSIWSQAIATYVANRSTETLANNTVSVNFSVPAQTPTTSGRPRRLQAATTAGVPLKFFLEGNNTLPPTAPPKVVMSPLTVSYSIFCPPGYTAEAVMRNLNKPGVSCQIQEDVRRAVKNHPNLTQPVKDTADMIVVSTCLRVVKQGSGATVAVPLGIAGGILALCAIFLALMWFRRRNRQNEGKKSPPDAEDYEDAHQNFKDATSIVPSAPDPIVHALEPAGLSPRSDVDSKPVGEISMPEGQLNPAVVQPWLQRVYERYNPSKLYRVDQLLTEYRGREASLVEAVSNKYRLDPTHFERHYARNQRMSSCGTCCVCSPLDSGGARPVFAQTVDARYLHQEGDHWPEEEQERHNTLRLPVQPTHAPSRPSR